MSIWENFWNVLWAMFWVFAFVAYLFAIFAIIGDLFRDHKLNGWLKALWIIFLIFVPFITALVYLIARGKSMAERQAKDIEAAQKASEQYIKQVASSSSPAEEINKAKGLLDSGAITAAEFEALKTKALA
ncbi:MAG TPA: SHOCT domain-containing protein [Microterricola sp.]